MRDQKNKPRTRDIITLLIFFAVTIPALFQIPKIYVDSSTNIFIPENHEITKIDRAIEKEFGPMDSIIMGVQVNFGSVLEPEVLIVIDEITRALESSKEVKRVLSLTNMDFMAGTEDGLEVTPLLKDLSKDSIKELKKRLASWNDLYAGTFISSDSKLSAIIIQPEQGTSAEAGQILYEQIKELAAEYETENLNFPIAGLPAITEEISESIMSDLFWLIPVAALLILGVLFLSFRRWEGVVFPITGLAVAVVWVMGMIAVLNITFTMATLLVPVLLLVVGSAYGIHVMSHFYEDIDHQSGFLDHKAVDIIINKNLKTVVIPVILAGVTTASGFISLVSSPLGPFRTFGALSAVGVIFSQLTSLILIPALLRLRYRRGIDTEKYHRIKDRKKRTKTPAAFVLLEHIVRKKKWITLLISAAIFGTTIALIPKITVGTDIAKFFTPESRVVKDISILNEKLSGSNFMSVMITAPESGDILEPEFLLKLEDFETYLSEECSNVKKVQTIVPSIKRINKLMNQESVPYAASSAEEPASFDFFGGNGLPDNKSDDAAEEEPVPPAPNEDRKALFSYEEMAAMLQESRLSAGNNASPEEFISTLLALGNYQGEAFNEIPADPEKYGFTTQKELKNLISQYLVLYSGNLDMIINDSLEPDKTQIIIQLTDISQKKQTLLMNAVNSFWNYYLPEGWSYVIGGGAALQYVLSNLVIRSQYISLIAALVIVWIIVAAMFRSPLAGVIGLIPVFFALAGIFLFMILFRFNLDIITSLLASLAIGIGVDYAIHIMNAYKRNIAAGAENSLNVLYKTTGKAVFINAVSIAVGFTSLMISQFVPIRQMGILFAVSMIFACLASLIVLPIVLIKLKPRFLEPKAGRKQTIIAEAGKLVPDSGR